MPVGYTSYTEEYAPQHVYKFTTRRCPLCQGDPIVIVVPAKEMNSYGQGVKHIQDALPSLTASERERLFMTHYCEACMDAMKEGE